MYYHIILHFERQKVYARINHFELLEKLRVVNIELS